MPKLDDEKEQAAQEAKAKRFTEVENLIKAGGFDSYVLLLTLVLS